MTEPRSGYAPLHAGLIGIPRDTIVDGLANGADDTARGPRWREDLRFFLVCYFSAFCGFLLLLG